MILFVYLSYRKKTRRTSAVLMDDSIVSESSMDRKYVTMTLGGWGYTWLLLGMQV